MSITKLNSLAIPPNTIVESDLSYPLTNFSSTGIDDNATSTKLTVADSAITTGSIDQLIVAHSTDGGGIRIDSTNSTNTGSLRFGDDLDNYIGALEYNHTSNAMSMYVNNATRMTINSSGNVGIGTTSPSSSAGWGTLLEISGTTNAGIKLTETDTANGDYSLGVTAGTFRIWDETASAFRLTLDGSGNVGIGTSSPSELLDVGDHTAAGNRNIRISQRTGSAGTTYGGLEFFYDNSAGTTGVNAAIKYAAGPLRNDGELTFHTGASASISERLRIDHNGRVGIGTTSPSATLDVKGSARIERDGSSALLQFTDTGVNSRWMGLVDGTSRFAIYGTNGSTEELVIDSSGNVGIGTTSLSSTLTVNKDTGTTPTVYINNSAAFATEGAALKVQASGRGAGVADVSIFSVHNNTDELFTVRNDGNVGIGTTSPDSILHLSGSSSSKIIIEDSASPRGNYIGINSSDNLVIAADEDNLGSSSNIQFRVDATERMRILSGGGLTFNGDTATANALDDYEEGTWTPVSNSGTIGTVSAQYTKIGRQVFVSAKMLDFSDYTSTTGIQISGLPYTSADPSNVVGAVMYRNVNDSSIADLTVYMGSNDSHFNIYLSKNNGGLWESLTYASFDSGLGDVYVSFSYIV